MSFSLFCQEHWIKIISQFSGEFCSPQHFCQTVPLAGRQGVKKQESFT